MTTHPMLAAIIGGWELLFIFAVLFVLALGVAITVGIVFFIVRATRKKPGTAPPPVHPGSSESHDNQKGIR
jgi:hypothetical protein